MTDPRNSLAMARIMTLAFPFLLIAAVAVEAAEATGAGAAAAATAGSDQNSARVPYADLDLTHPSGRAEFEKRLDRAIKDVCRQRFSRSARAATHAHACIADARQRVAAQRNAALAYKGG